ncbi:histidine phosphatase family protein [Reichenbachiella agarivorans]|uniref:Histidine phosphatase family protein n=1 Tax=Reichenbachiella agarivorans TaxID=2979464 RepID=A0ABY6CMP2_9BACT|nr:histidine phosphatase family protein [Reichenbachiella agarivorans]UXP31771.1 histidine phosphatase family protein [Reichenbachiella agarivorans]
MSLRLPIKRQLIVVRHAKSSWDYPGLADHDRPLGERGLRDAPKMAAHLKVEVERPQVLISSTALRAKQTAEYFIQSLKILREDSRETRDLFHANYAAIRSVLASIDAEVQRVIIFGHNPGLTDFVNRITDEDIFNIPTCGVAVIDLELSDWTDIDRGTGTLRQYFYPKGIDNSRFKI